MATEKRLIDANALYNKLEQHLEIFVRAWTDFGLELPRNEKVRTDEIVSCLAEIINAPTVDAVPVELLNTLKSLVNGEWVDCKLVQDALGIGFADGLKMFDFSRTAEWNPAPLNGQKITTKFRLKNSVHAVEVKHGRWVDANGIRKSKCGNCGIEFGRVMGDDCHYCPNCGAKMDGDGNG